MCKALKFILPVLILAAAFGVFRYLKATKPEQEPPRVQERAWRVEVEPAKPRRLAPELELYGRVETPDLLRAAASAPAWVAEVAVRDGDLVAKGDLLVRLDGRDFQHRIAQAQAQVAELQAQIESEKNRHRSDLAALDQERRILDKAGDAVERQTRLKTQKVGAEQALDEAEQLQAQQALAVSNREMSIADHPSRLRALEARLDSARARRSELELELERASLRAPYDGIVAGVEVTEGDQVAQGAVLVRLYAVEGLEVRARIPATYQAELIAALEGEAPMQAHARIGDERLTLRLDRLAGEADPSGVDGLFRVEGEPAMLRVGQMLTLRLQRPARDDLVPVPFRAVYGNGRLYVLDDGRLRGVDAETFGGWTSPEGREYLLVRAPELRAGTPVVVNHMPNALEGLKVEPVKDHSLVEPDPRGEDDLTLPALSGPATP
jgi:multidrug efflux pump subunit AcrA (membrane-fusion protein)